MRITGGKFNSRKLNSPKGDNVRPTLSKTRAAIFDILQGLIDFEEKSFLDLFAGSGIMGLEAVSRGFAKSFAIEKDKKTYLVVKSNYETLDIEPNVLCGDSLKILKKLSDKFDVVYIDPPYRANLYNPVLDEILSCKLLKPGGIVVLEHLQDESINWEKFEVIKQKKYGDKVISFAKVKA